MARSVQGGFRPPGAEGIALRRYKRLKREASARLFGVSLQSQENFSFDVTHTHERLDSDFCIERGFILPIDSEYTFTRYRVNYQTANRRTLAVSSRYV